MSHPSIVGFILGFTQRAMGNTQGFQEGNNKMKFMIKKKKNCIFEPGKHKEESQLGNNYT